MDVDLPAALLAELERTRDTRIDAQPLFLSPPYTLARDLFYEICSYLGPRDLLHLSRTTRAMRRELRCKSSQALWKNVLNTWPGLPECTTWLNGPRYAWLAFCDECQGCGKTSKDTVTLSTLWTLALRLCYHCKDSAGLIVVSGKSLSRAPQVAVSEVVRTTKFWTPQEFRYKYICCGSTLPHLLDRFQLELSAVPDDRLDEFIEDKRKMVKYIDEHEHRCFEFKSRYNKPTYEETLDAVLSTRYWDVRRKLIDLWEPLSGEPQMYDLIMWDVKYKDVAGEYGLRNHRLLKIPKPLTDHEWGNIRDEIVSYMATTLVPVHNRHREDLLWERRHIAYDTFLRTSGCATDFQWKMQIPLNASFADLIELPSFKEVIEKPSHEDVTPASFRMHDHDLKFLRDHHKWVDDMAVALFWHVGLYETLREYTEEERGELQLWDEAPLPEIDGEDAEDRFWLATTVFRCTGAECAEPSAFRRRVSAVHDDVLVHPFVMDHVCLRGRLLPPTGDNRYPTPVRWRPDCMTLNRPLQTVLQGIVLACGADPGKATHDDMDARDARLVCALCLQRRPFRKHAARSWWRCALHYIHVHKDRDAPETMAWRRLAEEAEECAQEIAPRHPWMSWRSDLYRCHYRTFCTACPLDEQYDDRAIHYRRMERHWKKAHAGVMLDEGERKWEPGYVLRPHEPLPVTLKALRKRLGDSDLFVAC